MHTQYQEDSNAGVSTSEHFPVIQSTRSGSIASTSGEDLLTARGCVDYSMLHMGLYPNISLSTPPPLTSAVSFDIPNHMPQPHLFHHLNPPCHPLPSHHLPFFNESSEFPPQIAPYQPSHFTPSPLTPPPLTPTPTSFIDFPVLASSTQQPFQCFPQSASVSVATAHSLPSFASLTNSGCLSSHIVDGASGYCCWPPLTNSSPSSPPSSSSSLFSSSISSQQMLP